MPNQKISQLQPGAPAQDTDLFPIARSGANFSLSVTDVQAGILNNTPLTGVTSIQQVGNVVFADQQIGANWAIQVNAADALLGSEPGEIWITPVANITVAPTVDITLSAGHVLRMFGGTYNLAAHSILLSGTSSTASGLVGEGRDIVIINYTGSGSAIAPANSTNNLTRNGFLRGFTLNGGSGAGVGIDLLNANSWLVQDFHISHFSGSGGVSIRIRGAGTTAGAYFNRFYNGFIDNAATAVLINYDIVANIPTSYEFDNVHLNVVTNGYDIQGSTGWLRDCYLENVSGIAMRFRTTAINHFLRAIFLDNSGSGGAGTGLQFDSGASDNRAQVSISGFSTNLTDSGANNDYAGMNTALWKVNSNGTFTGYNAADADYISGIRSGVTADQNTFFGYENHDGTKVWFAGQAASGAFKFLFNNLSTSSPLTFNTDGSSTFTPGGGLDKQLNVDLQAGSTSEQLSEFRFLDKSSTVQWYFRKDAVNDFNLFDSNNSPRLGFQPGTNGFSSLSGAGTGFTALAFSGSGGTRFGNGDGATTVAIVGPTGTLQIGGTAPTVAAGQLGLGGSTSATATAGAATLPTAPVGFLVVNIAGTNFKLPYYAV